MEYSDGYVAFIDILGFSNYVGEEQNMQKVSQLFSFVEKFCYLHNTSPQLGVNVSFFSDSIVLSADEFYKLVVPISIAESYLKSELHLLFRGGITKGKYYHSRGVTFGPAVVAAYRLENQAVYSRILLDDKIMENDNNDYIAIFRDTDGKWCLNIYALTAFSGTSYGPDGEHYPEGDPGEIVLDNFRKSRHAILEAINAHLGTPAAEKYIWRIRPFNFACEKYAAQPKEIPIIRERNYDPTDDFSKALLDMRITSLYLITQNARR